MTAHPLADLGHALERRLAAASRRHPDLAGELQGLIDLVRLVGDDAENPYTGPGHFDYPVCWHWPAVLDHADPAVADLAPVLRELGRHLRWHQTGAYRRHPPGPGFLDNYGYAVIAGPADGAPALLRHDRLALGVLMLGPDTHYPRHHHPAREIYLPLHPAQWWRGDGPWRPEPPGAVIYHASGESHATRTGNHPLLALYLWVGDLATSARFSHFPQ